MKHFSGAIGLLMSAVVGIAQADAQRSSIAASVTDDTAQVEWPPEFDSIVALAGLAPLRSVVMPKSGRDKIRIWIGGGLGYPQDLYRIVDDGKGRVSGSLIFHWPADEPNAAIGGGTWRTFYDVVLHHQRGRCRSFRSGSGVATCIARFTKPPAWDKVLKQAEEAGLWTLPDASSLPPDNIFVFDGWGISIELRDDKQYRAYSYSNPQAHTKWPEAKQAERIATAVQTVQSLVRPSSTTRHGCWNR